MTPPDYMNKIAKAEWKRIVPAMKKENLALDRSLLIDYCQTYADEVELTKSVEEFGRWYIGPNDAQCATQASTQLHKAKQLLARLRTDLGLTPKARSEKPQSEPEKPKIKGL
jgi:P27 family predicted phage terminase small subunit